MSEKYQPIVLNHTNEIIGLLRETNFFVDYELESEDFAKEYLCEKLTEKFILGELSDEFDIEVISEDEMEKYLREIVAGSILMELQENGLIDSMEDENNTEHFFLTDKGKELAENIKNNLEIRPHHGQNSTGQNLDNWWHNQLPTVKVSDATIPFIKQVNNAKIVIIAHNGTTLPENLAKAIPTLITWTSNWVEIRDEAKPVFAKLAEVGIFHEDPVSLAKHVSAIWDNVDAWWESKEVVEARELFCSQYARSVPQPRKFLREIIVGKSIIEKQGDL